MRCQRCNAISALIAQHHPTGRCPTCARYFDPRLVIAICPDCHKTEHRARSIAGFGDKHPRCHPHQLRARRAELTLRLGLRPGAPARLRQALRAAAAHTLEETT
jgi:hypothetical protein